MYFSLFAELTSKFRGSEIIELQNFKPASVDDIANVHTKAYVAGLEKTFQESLVAAGAGITLVNSVHLSAPRIHLLDLL
uniref:Histone deacetylase n=1 Tax=Salix viminalis TaxID=40686 RepID=A0A6N2KWC5_SALVM